MARLVSTMSLEQKKIEDKTIDRLMDKFTSDLDVDDILLAKCLSKGLITENNMSRIGAIFRGGRTAEAAMDLMSHVKRSPPGYLKTFCDILNDSKSSFLVPYVEEEYRAQSEAKRKPAVPFMFSPHSDVTRDCLLSHHQHVLSSLNMLGDSVETIASMKMDNSVTSEMPDIYRYIVKLRMIMFRYFQSVYQKHGIVLPVNVITLEEVLEEVALEIGDLQILQALPNLLLEVGEALEDATVKASVEKYKSLHINSDNVHSQFTKNVSAVLDTGPPTWKKVVTFVSSAAGFGVYLCTNNMSHLATQLPDWTAQILQHRLQPWIDDQGGWESFLSYGKDVLSRAKGMKKKKQWKSSAVMYGRFHGNQIADTASHMA